VFVDLGNVPDERVDVPTGAARDGRVQAGAGDIYQAGAVPPNVLYEGDVLDCARLAGCRSAGIG
jgi:hypothetical protein